MDGDGIDLRSVVELLRRQLSLLIITLAVTVGIAFGYLATVTPVYTAETLVLVDLSQRNLLSADPTNGTSAQSNSARIESEVGILRSPAMALSVIQAADLVQDPEFGPSIGLRDRVMTALGLGNDTPLSGDELTNQMISRLQDAISVRREGLTYLISIGVTAEHPSRAARIANTMAATYIDNQVASKVTATLAARDILQTQITAGLDAVARSDRALDQFIDNNLSSIELEAGNPRLIELRLQLDELRVQQERTENLADLARSALEDEDYALLATRLGDAALSELAQERDALRRQLGQVDAGTAAEIDLRAALEDVEEDLAQGASARVGSLRLDVAELNAQIGGSRQDLREELLASDIPSEALAQIFELQQEARIARSQYETVLSRLRDVEAQASTQIADSRIVSEALPPVAPSAPNTRLVLALAVVMGLGLGVGLAFLNEYYVGGVTNAGQLRDIIGVPVATSIPFESERLDAGQSIADKILHEPLSPYSESIRRLRAAIDQGWRKRWNGQPEQRERGSDERYGANQAGGASEQERGRIILVTSAVPAEGKTTLALSLARVYANSGQPTLLIDADLRKPSVHRQVGIQPKFGLLDFILDEDEKLAGRPFFVREPNGELDLLLGAGRSNIPTDQIISSRTFDGIIEWARNNYSIVVVDTSPILPVVDARYIAHHADAIVFSVRYATTSQSDLRSSTHAMLDAMAPKSDFYTVLSHHQYRQKGYKYDGYYLAYGEDA